MFMIVLHHYCVNAGFEGLILSSNCITVNTVLIQFMSVEGKVGVNIFFLISVFFMINSLMKWEKVFKLLAQILFYNVIVFVFLSLLGYNYGMKDALGMVPIIAYMPFSFISSYLIIYLLSSIINNVLKTISRTDFNFLLVILLFYFVIAQSFFFQNTWHYLGWAFTMYCVCVYIRLYNIQSLNLPYGKLAILILFSIWGYILFVDYYNIKYWIFVIGDANKITMFLLAVSLFLCFANLKVRYNKVINTFGGAAFGVLMFHANNDLMRQWLWTDFLKNTDYYTSHYLWFHMVISVVSIYLVCTLIEVGRKKYIENPIFSKIYG